MKSKEEGRAKRKASIRKRLSGTTERPRLSVFRSANHIYAQVIDDTKQATLVAASTIEKDVKGTFDGAKKRDQAKKIGELIAKRCLEKGIDKVVFDRNGFI